MLKYFVIVFSVFASLQLSAQLVINEVSQGAGGNQPSEYVELLVVGTRTCIDSCANLQGWILDDNNGFFGSSGIAGGHIRFNNDPQWQCVPFGTIIVIYNALNPYTGIVVDETDANNDNVYFLTSNSSYFESNSTTPTSGVVSTTYAGTTYSAGGLNWTSLGMSNSNDVFQTVAPTSLTSGYHSVGWGNTTGTNISFAGSASGLLYQNENITNDNPNTQTNWTSQNENLASPGTGNSIANIAWINTMRNSPSNTDTTINETICNGDSIFFDNQYLHLLGIYTDTLIAFSGCDSIVTLNLNIQTCTNCDMDLRNDTLICGSTNFLLDAGIFDEYLWQDGSTNQTYTATGTGQYYCQGTNYEPTNLVVNGDFEAGAVNFSTDYIPGTGGSWGLLSNPSQYAITTSPSLAHNNFLSCGDHTSGSGNMFVANGSSAPNSNAWCQTITVIPNTDYIFSAWAINADGVSTQPSQMAELRFSVNGTAIGATFLPSVTVCNWTEFQATWNSGLLTSITLCIENTNFTPGGGGADFALDDIFFGEYCIATDTINILNNAILNTLNENICEGDSLFFDNQYLHLAGTYSDTLASAQGCDSIITLNLSVQVCCVYENYSLENFEFNTAIPGIIPGTTYQTTPQTFCPYSGTRSFYGNFQNGFAGEFYNNDFDVCSNAEMRFSFWTKDCFSSSNNINYEIRDANGVVISGPHNFINTTGAGWQQIVSPSFVSSTNSITISMSNVTPGGGGNDVSLDDFLLEICTQSSTTNDVVLCTANAINLYDSLNANNFSTLGVWSGPSILTNGSLGTFDQVNQNDGLYSYSMLGVNNCPDTVNYINISSSLIVNTISVSLCSGESYVLSDGTSVSITGIYSDTFQTAQNCDSILTINLTVSNIFSETVTAQICNNDNYTLPNGQIVNTTGVYLDTLQSIGTCDSVITTNLSVSPAPTTSTTNTCTNISINAGQTIDTTFNISGCPTAFNIINSVYNTPDDYELLDATICEGDSILIFDSFESEADIYFDTIFSVLGCDSILKKRNLIVNPFTNINAGNDMSIAMGNSASLNATGATAYIWSTGETSANISVAPQNTTNYIVEDANGCSSDSVTVFVINEDVEILIPNAFTPNADNLNDVFKIVNEDDFENISIRVYNRWGAIVFSSTETVKAWDGAFNGIDQQEDYYLYYIEATSKTTQKLFNVSGSVSIIR